MTTTDPTPTPAPAPVPAPPAPHVAPPAPAPVPAPAPIQSAPVSRQAFTFLVAAMLLFTTFGVLYVLTDRPHMIEPAEATAVIMGTVIVTGGFLRAISRAPRQ
ncbi:hypothetical protein [Streptomyces cyaneofuscatus]|uniref:hypothetical protein n=1 Tax=Streptomyces cyaneofuscatus TaxID=66883 RepID=UPI0038080273